jgi:hypothetical protein
VTRLLAWLDARVTPQRVVLLLCLEVLVLACENALMFPVSVPYMRRATGHVYLDMCAFCSSRQLYAELDAFGETGRQLQLLMLSSVDLVIPLVSGVFGATALSLLTRRLRARRPGWRWLLLAPIAATTLDFGENMGLALLVTRYPQRMAGLATITAFTTGLKSVAYVLTLVAVVVLAATSRVTRHPQAT